MIKKIFSLSVFLMITTKFDAQNYQVSTSFFDLENLKLHKEWRIYSGFKDKDGNYVIKFGKPSCNMTSQSGINSIHHTYYGVQYDFEELTFDKNFNYINKTSKSYPTTFEALKYEPIFGERFFPIDPLHLLKRPINSEYVGKTTVIPVIDFGGFRIGLFSVVGKVNGGATNAFGQTNYYACSENIWLEKIDARKTKENKGERWASVSNYPLPGGGVVLYSTSGVVPETDKAVYIAKKYDADLNETAREELYFDFKCVVHILPLDRKDGSRDFVVIAQADDGNKTQGKKIVDATQGELLILDGNNLKVKNRSVFKMEYSRWYPDDVTVDSNGNIFIYGTCSKDTKTYAGWLGSLPINVKSPNLENLPDEQPNYQILFADPNGNVKYVKGVNSKLAGDVAKVIGGTGKKAKNEVIFNTYDFYKEVAFTDKYFIIAGQQFIGRKKDGADKGNLFLAVFDISTGKLLHYFIKPEDTYATFDLVFNKDRSKVYWVTYDWDALNNIENENGAITAKKIKSMIAGYLHLCTIDLNSGNASNFEVLGKDQWAVSFWSPLIVRDDNSDEFIFQGRTLTKKAKDSELVIIKVKKN